MTTDAIQVTTTTATREEAQRIATALIEQRLAACVQIFGPITSIYHWRGQVETSEEWLCVIKSRNALYNAIEQTIRALHSYEVPEILAFAIETGSRDYLAWIRRETGTPDPFRTI